jgi:hypothetical protein
MPLFRNLTVKIKGRLSLSSSPPSPTAFEVVSPRQQKRMETEPDEEEVKIEERKQTLDDLQSDEGGQTSPDVEMPDLDPLYKLKRRQSKFKEEL